VSDYLVIKLKPKFIGLSSAANNQDELKGPGSRKKIWRDHRPYWRIFNWRVMVRMTLFFVL